LSFKSYYNFNITTNFRIKTTKPITSGCLVHGAIQQAVNVVNIMDYL